MSDFAATSRQEQRYCQLFASKVFTGLGRIVEFGPWLGSLTKALGRGLAANPRIKKDLSYVDAFDRFQWDSFMEMWVEGSHLADKYRDTEIFVDEYKNQIRDFLEYVNV